MRSPVIVDAVRTAIGRRYGQLSGIHPATLLGGVQRTLLERSQIAPEEVGQVVGGCVTQIGEQSFNVTRIAWLQAGLAPGVAASTVDCQCGSSQQANHLVHNLVHAEVIDIGIACGVESMSRVPIGANMQAPGRPKPADFPLDMPNQFVGAERIAKKYGLTRADVDGVGLSSQRRAATAIAEGRFVREIVPVTVPPGDPAEGAARSLTVDRDEGPRTSSAEALGKLRPILPGGIHTAGNTSQISDGAAAVLWMDEDLARARGLRPRARIRAQVLVGSDPYLHIEGPIDATAALLKRSGMAIGDIDLFEINEAFAAVTLAWLQVYDADHSRLNVNGGAIALGHPMGASGARLITSALHELERRDACTALIAMCCGGSMATGTILERL